MKADLNGMFNGLSGKMGNLTYSQTPNGTIIKQVKKPANPKTPAQVAARARMRTASTAYAGLTPAQVALWTAYAQTVVKFDKQTETHRRPNSFTAYTGLACKFLQVNPAGTAPATPPTKGFSGDGIQVTVTAGAGKLVFAANAKNAPGVTTEILVQPLKNANRKPQLNRYRSKGFQAFSPPATFDLAVTAGAYAVAIRFVNIATGQDTDIVPLGVYTVS